MSNTNIHNYVKYENIIYNAIRLQIVDSRDFCEYILRNSTNSSKNVNIYSLYIGYISLCRYNYSQILRESGEHFLLKCCDISFAYIYYTLHRKYIDKKYTKNGKDVSLAYLENISFKHKQFLDVSEDDLKNKTVLDFCGLLNKTNCSLSVRPE